MDTVQGTDETEGFFPERELLAYRRSLKPGRPLFDLSASGGGAGTHLCDPAIDSVGFFPERRALALRRKRLEPMPEPQPAPVMVPFFIPFYLIV